MSEAKAGRPFAPFEWKLAGRYLTVPSQGSLHFGDRRLLLRRHHAGRRHLIIVMAVMNGFRGQLMDKILGINGHAVVQPIDSPDRLCLGRRSLAASMASGWPCPSLKGRCWRPAPPAAFGVLVRGVRSTDLQKLPLVYNTVQIGSFDKFDEGIGVAIGQRLAESLGVTVGDKVTLVSPKGNVTALGTTPRSRPIRCRRSSRSA
jgi:ABC-type transport system, involved in lipoprotein release, permease component